MLLVVVCIRGKFDLLMVFKIELIDVCVVLKLCMIVLICGNRFDVIDSVFVVFVSSLVVLLRLLVVRCCSMLIVVMFVV